MSAQNAANVVHVRNLEQERLLKCYFQIEKKIRIFENSRVKKIIEQYFTVQEQFWKKLKMTEMKSLKGWKHRFVEDK